MFYRCLMDGWDATHRTLRRWVDHDRPKASEVWRKFVEDGVLLGGKEELRSLELMPRPTLDELERAVSFGLEDYAITAFVQALYDAIDFVEATGAKLVAVARCIGMTMDDSEYTSIEF